MSVSRLSLKIRKRRVVIEKIRLAEVDSSGREKGRNGWTQSSVFRKAVVTC